MKKCAMVPLTSTPKPPRATVRRMPTPGGQHVHVAAELSLALAGASGRGVDRLHPHERSPLPRPEEDAGLRVPAGCHRGPRPGGTRR